MNHFIILDIETTGFKHDEHKITEIGAIKVDRNSYEIIDTFERLVQIDTEVPPFITSLTGITNELLNEEGEDIKKILTELSFFAKDLDIYAHYSPFDKKFIRHNLEIHNIEYHKTKWFDTIDLFKKYFPGRKSYKLAELMKDYNLGEEMHRALDDAKNTLKLIKIGMNIIK